MSRFSGHWLLLTDYCSLLTNHLPKLTKHNLQSTAIDFISNSEYFGDSN